MPEQVIRFVATGISLPETLGQVQAAVNTWLTEHPQAVVSTIDTELVPWEHSLGEWVYAVALAVRVPDAQR